MPRKSLHYIIVTGSFLRKPPVQLDSVDRIGLGPNCIVYGLTDYERGILKHDWKVRDYPARPLPSNNNAVSVDVFPHQVIQELGKLGYEVTSTAGTGKLHVTWTLCKEESEN